jgi:hypothetical protein
MCRTKFGRCGASSFRQATECFIAILCAFEDFAGDVPSSRMFLAPDREYLTCPFQGDFHIGEGSGIKAICNHGRFLPRSGLNAITFRTII